MIGTRVSSERTRLPPPVVVASAISVVLGLVFVFVRAPLPWGWGGIDHYQDLAMALARGEKFPTTDVPWGYAYFLAFFYRIAGARPWVPLTAQVIVNGLVPVVVYRLARPSFGERVAVVAALLTGVCSFNTIYASTQASDSICTVLFLGSLLLFDGGVSSDRPSMYALSGLLAGSALQFRPNLSLFPAVLAVVALWRSRPRVPLQRLVVYAVFVTLPVVPWTIRNYRLTGDIIPTSTHGGIQLWYGSLQAGPYLSTRVLNPRTAYEAQDFEYTSLANRSIVIDVASCAPPTLTYWTDRHPAPATLSGPLALGEGRFRFEIPGQPDQTAIYYYFASERPGTGEAELTPPRGARDPLVFFVDARHLVDIDRHQDLLDVFDLVRTIETVAWGVATQPAAVDVDWDGRITARDVERLAAALAATGEGAGLGAEPVMAGLDVSDQAASLRFIDGSTFTVPRAWTGLLTDAVPSGGIAAEVISHHWRMSALEACTPEGSCLGETHVAVNEVFYRREPHAMRRYTALALDNIRRDRIGFARASLFRTLRLFLVVGTSDARTAQQFEGSGRTYALATAATAVYLACAVAGLIIAVWRRMRIWLLLTPILYVPITICYVLTNMRYTVTVQPLVLSFAALALVHFWDRFAARLPLEHRVR